MNTSAYVEAGAAWLDEQEPGWWERIDLTILEMRNTCFCIWGQLHGNFENLYRHRGQAWCHAHGFTIDLETSVWGDSKKEFQKLQAEWSKQIARRREKNHEASVPNP